MPRGISHDSMSGFYYDTLPPGKMRDKQLALRQRFHGKRKGRPKRGAYDVLNRDLAEKGGNQPTTPPESALPEMEQAYSKQAGAPRKRRR